VSVTERTGAAGRSQDASEDTGSAAVELRGVTKRFHEVVAVDDARLSIANGEFFSLLGPSGCGKTTTLRMIAGLEYPTEGSIRIFGDEVGLTPPHRRPVNTVFQSYALFPHMTVADNVAFGLRMRKVEEGEIAERVERVLELVQLAGMEDRRPDQLSGGQQQRVALARALVNEPKVLLLDEPLGALDLKLRKAMQLELKALQEAVGITFIYVTHDQEEALTMSDRIGVMSDGRLLQVGTPEEIYEEPATTFVADFIGETSFLSGHVAADGEVELGEGVRVRAEATDRSPGSPVTLALRPERVDLRREDGQLPEGCNTVTGTVERRTYAGTTTSYEVAVAGEVLRVRLSNVGHHDDFAPGERVVVVWRPPAARVLEAEPELADPEAADRRQDG
jgi:spermidine/putrescine transport system ATP-binding protein